MASTMKSMLEVQDFSSHPAVDVIVRSADGVDFRSFKLMLSLASPVFAGMFTLDNHPTSTDQEEMDGLPVVKVSEHGAVVKVLLEMCNPGHQPTIEEGGDITEHFVGATLAAIKYDMRAIVSRLRMSLSNPNAIATNIGAMRVFAISVKCVFIEEARAAALRLLRVPLAARPFTPELDMISGGVMWRLTNHYVRCVEAAARVATQYDWIIYPLPLDQIDCTCTQSPSARFSSSKITAHFWFTDFMLEAKSVLAMQPCGAAVLETTILNRAIQKTGNCKSCQTCAINAMTEFVGHFAKKVDEVVSQVELDLVA